jgi:hypothetical protein
MKTQTQLKTFRNLKTLYNNLKNLNNNNIHLSTSRINTKMR